MRKLVVLGAAVAALSIGVSGIVAATSAGAASATSAAGATVHTVIRPVTAAGRAAPGFTVHRMGQNTSVNCADQSPVAVDKNIDICSPAAAYPVACWKSAKAHHVLCFSDAHSKQLRSIRLTGKFAHTEPPQRPVPLNLKLRSGAYCGLRIGGSGAPLKGHPNWGVTYYCTHGLAVWAKFSTRTAGVNFSHATWTVHVAPADGHSAKLHVRPVKHAWFVGTHS